MYKLEKSEGRWVIMVTFETDRLYKESEFHWCECETGLQSGTLPLEQKFMEADQDCNPANSTPPPKK